MLDAIQESHPTKSPPFVFDLTKDLPPIRDIQSSYEKLREICMPGKAVLASRFGHVYIWNCLSA